MEGVDARLARAVSARAVLCCARGNGGDQNHEFVHEACRFIVVDCGCGMYEPLVLGEGGRVWDRAHFLLICLRTCATNQIRRIGSRQSFMGYDGRACCWARTRTRLLHEPFSNFRLN
ncbi:unnamed protein product [Scytosiphon promiscuus]